MLEAIRLGQLAGDGSFTKKCKQILESEMGAKAALLTTSCTHALEMSALLLNINPGDEVIVPSFTFVSTINAFVLRGAKPVFVDIRQDTKNVDEAQVARLITNKTKAIVLVHYAGVACEMDAIMPIAKENGIAIVEDNAHGIFGKYKNRPLGSFGEMSTLSFHETKNIQCGEGGALVINDERFVERAEIIREKGTDRSKFFRGQVDKYSWVDVGSSYLLSDVLAAFLFGQLEQREYIQERRRQIWHNYFLQLSDWSHENDVTLPVVPDHCEQSYHMFYMMLPSIAAREELIDFLKARGIWSVFHYVPLHTSHMGASFGFKPGDCPVTEFVSDRLLRLPFYESLSAQEQDIVIQAVRQFSVKGNVALEQGRLNKLAVT
jgi:dTDP-4-amino-4,6-dideoxygalactose transaminase